MFFYRLHTYPSVFCTSLREAKAERRKRILESTAQIRLRVVEGLPLGSFRGPRYGITRVDLEMTRAAILLLLNGKKYSQEETLIVADYDFTPMIERCLAEAQLRG